MNDIDLKDFIISESDYELGKALGKGSYATVFAARDKKTKEVLALKKFHSNFTSEQSRKMFIREVEVMAKFMHPCVLALRGYYLPEDDESINVPLILMDYMKRGDLFTVLVKESKNKAPVGWNPTKKMINAFGIAYGMAHIHKVGGIHRDLKPANVMLNDNYEPKIADFGLSKLQDENNTMSMIGGSPFWMAPELFMEKQYDNKVDVYAYGVLLYQLLTNLIPFNGKITTIALGNKIMNGERPEIPDTLSPFYAEIISACWAQLPGQRPTFEQVYNRLLQATEFLPGTNVAEYKAYQQTVMREAENIKPGVRVDHYKEGMELFNQGNYQAAADELQRATKSSGDACYQLAMMKLNGLGITKDLSEAAKLFKQASDLGNILGTVECGKLLFYGQGVPERKDTAAEYFIKAAKKNNEEATIFLAEMLINGEGVEENPGKALKLLSMASSRGGVEAAYKLGVIYSSKTKCGEQNLEQAKKYLTIAAQKGHKEAQELLNKLNALNTVSAFSPPPQKQPSFDIFASVSAPQLPQATVSTPKQPSFDMFAPTTNQELPQATVSTPKQPSFDIFASQAQPIATQQKTPQFGNFPQQTQAQISLQTKQSQSKPVFDIFAQTPPPAPSSLPFQSQGKSLQNSFASPQITPGVTQVTAPKELPAFDPFGFQVPQPQPAPTTQQLQPQPQIVQAKQPSTFDPFGLNIPQPQPTQKPSSQPGFLDFSVPQQQQQPVVIQPPNFDFFQQAPVESKNPTDFTLLLGNKEPPKATTEQTPFNLPAQQTTQFSPMNLKMESDYSPSQSFVAKPSKLVSLPGDESLSDQEKSQRWYQYAMKLTETGTESKMREAARYLKQAAVCGHVEAQYQCGMLLLRGIGVEKNPQKAAVFFSQAAKNGHNQALLECSRLLSEGNGVRKDLRKAAYMCKLAADRGNLEAIFEFGVILTSGIGVQKNVYDANDFFKAAADMGHVRSQLIIAYNYQNGIGTPTDYSSALRYYKLAADQNDPDALCNYGRMFEQGLGVKQDVYEAANCYRAAALMGSTLGMFNYAVMLDNGSGTAKDVDSAAKFYKMAADRGDADSCLNYANLLAQGWPNHPKDMEGCATYAKLAADAGNVRGIFMYGKLLYSGKGVPKNTNYGATLIKQAAKQGYDRAARFCKENGIIVL